jgi:hypothetical protein
VLATQTPLMAEAVHGVQWDPLFWRPFLRGIDPGKPADACGRASLTPEHGSIVQSYGARLSAETASMPDAKILKRAHNNNNNSYLT